MSIVFLVVSMAHAENWDGVYSVISKEGAWTNQAILLSHGATGGGGIPGVALTEAYCTPDTFRWPQVIAAGSTASWIVFPLKDADPGTSITCTDHVDSSTKRTFTITPCSGGGCPAVSGAGPWIAPASSTPIVSLKPGLYHVTSHREDTSGTRTSATADMFVRPTANANEHLETWCVGSGFLWPQMSQSTGGVTYKRTWLEYTVDATNGAPATVTCPGGTTRADFKYTID